MMCSICLETLEESTSSLVELPCNHIFCIECIAGWKEKGGKDCPNCRATLPGLPNITPDTSLIVGEEIYDEYDSSEEGDNTSDEIIVNFGQYYMQLITKICALSGISTLIYLIIKKVSDS